MSFLPLFPLNLVAFPGEDLNLHIFEPRYKQLILECSESNSTFGIPAYIDNKLMDIGTEMKLISIEKKYKDGKMDIKSKAIGLFKILDFTPKVDGKMYSGADVKSIPIEETGDIVRKKVILEKVKELFEILNIKKEIPEEFEYLKTFKIAHHVGFNIHQKYKFLTITSENERQEFMLDHLTRLIPIVEEMERLRERIQLNGHFKNIIPPKIDG